MTRKKKKQTLSPEGKSESVFLSKEIQWRYWLQNWLDGGMEEKGGRGRERRGGERERQRQRERGGERGTGREKCFERGSWRGCFLGEARCHLPLLSPWLGWKGGFLTESLSLGFSALASHSHAHTGPVHPLTKWPRAKSSWKLKRSPRPVSEAFLSISVS